MTIMRQAQIASADGGLEAPVPRPPRPNLQADIAALASLDLHELRIRWRKLFRSTAPKHLPRFLLVRMIAYRAQANAFGDLDRETARYLDRIARQRRNGGKAGVPPVPDERTGKLKPRTILVREHEGVLHRVMVVEDGFAWNGATHRSLSEVARAITGTNWNGPLFFGLRKRAKMGRVALAESRIAP